jgi:hypothetical protein
MLYFLPGEMQRKADGIWTRWARVMDDLIGVETASAAESQAPRCNLAPSPASRGLWSARGLPPLLFDQLAGRSSQGASSLIQSESKLSHSKALEAKRPSKTGDRGSRIWQPQTTNDKPPTSSPSTRYPLPARCRAGSPRLSRRQG